MDNIFKADYKVRISDCDRFGRLKMPALLQMLQEIATEHARVIGVGFDDLKPLGLGWALSKIVVEISRIPHWGERVFLSTWSSFRERIATYREFSAVDADGKPLFTARSQWLLFDMNSRRIARLERIADWQTHPETANSWSFDEPFPKIDAAAPSAESDFSARNDDIDLNGHVNNSVYMIWAVESVPSEFAQTREPQRVGISFLDEVLPHNRVAAFCQLRGDRSITSVRSGDGSRECARVFVDWRGLRG